MVEFGARFREAITATISVGCSLELWKGIAIFVLFCVAQAAIMTALYFVRKMFHNRFKSVWPRRVFSLVRWFILTPAWALLTIGVLYALGMDLSGSVTVAIVIFLIYGLICLEGAKWKDW